MILPFLNVTYSKGVAILKLCGKMATQASYDLMGNLDITQFHVRGEENTLTARENVFSPVGILISSSEWKTTDLPYQQKSSYLTRTIRVYFTL